MNAARKGSALLIEARLRAYDQALAAGKTTDEARATARKITSKHITGVRTDTSSEIINRAVAKATA